MTFDFNKLVTIGFDKWKTAPFRFYGEKEPFFIGNKIEQNWQDVILSGNTALTLVNAKANGLNYLKLFGATEQSGTPTPTTPVDIVSNNGVLKVSPNLIDESTLYKVSSTMWRYYSTISQGGFDLKANTTYTLSTDTTDTYVYFYDYDTRTAVANGKHSRTYTPTEDIKVYFALYLSSGILENTHIQLEIGSTATTYRPYGSVYYDGTVETVEVHGKNLFHPSITPSSFGAYLGVSLLNYLGNYMCKLTRKTNEDVPSGNFGVVYKHKNSNASARWFINQGVENSTYIPNGLLIGSIIQTDLEWISLACYPSNAITWNAFLNAYNIQIEQGSTATPYEPYYNGGSATAVNLLGVLNKSGQNIYAQDVQNVTTGAITRNVGVKVFDGTETWAKSTNTDADGNNVFYSVVADRKLRDTNIGMFCTHYVSKGTVSYLTLKAGEMSILQSAGNVYFDGGGITTKDNWVAYVKQQFNNGTPIIIVYPLATATTETVTGQPLNIQAGTNIVEITQASIDKLGLEVSYKAGVKVTITEVQNANLSNQVTVTIGG